MVTSVAEWRIVDEAMKRFGRIDVLVNNAGYSLLGNFERMTTAEIQQQFATNCAGRGRRHRRQHPRRRPRKAAGGVRLRVDLRTP